MGMDWIGGSWLIIRCLQIDPRILFHSLDGLKKLAADTEKLSSIDEEMLFELWAGIDSSVKILQTPSQFWTLFCSETRSILIVS